VIDIQRSIYGAVLLAEIGDRQILPLDFWNGAGSSLIARRKLDSPAELEGLKVKSFGDFTASQTIAYVGAAPSFVTSQNASLALQTGVIDAMEISNESEINAYLGEYSAAYFRPRVWVIAVSLNAWKSWSEQERQLFSGLVRDAADSKNFVIKVTEEVRKNRFESETANIMLDRVMRFELASFLANRPVSDDLRSAHDLLEEVREQIGQEVKGTEDARQRPDQRGDIEAIEPKTDFVAFITDRHDEGEAVELQYRFGARQNSLRPQISCGLLKKDLGVSIERLLRQSNTNIRKGEECLEELDRLAEAQDGTIRLYVHGYRNSFGTALARAIQLQEAISDGAVFAFWAWPSANELGGYEEDENSILGSRKDFINFLASLMRRESIQNVDVVAHSMGSRLLIDLIEFADAGDLSELRHVIFVAPDVDALHFQRVLAEKAGVGLLRTLYASEQDAALFISSRRTKKQRAGEGGTKIVVVDAMDSVDATEVQKGFINAILRMEGHTHAFDIPEARSDLIQLLATGNRAANRNLGQRPNTFGQTYYWIIPGDQADLTTR
jgi:hypothetical protein